MYCEVIGLYYFGPTHLGLVTTFIKTKDCENVLNIKMTKNIFS